MICLLMSAVSFPEWLLEQMDSLRLSQADLARKSGLTTAAISRILTGSRDAGPDACRAIARALDLPEELVFRQAGLLSPETPAADAPNLAEWIHLYRKASPEERERMLELARVLSRHNRP